MATLTASAAQSVVPAKYIINGAISRTVSFNPGGVALSAGDVIQMVRVPSGAVINDYVLAISSSAQSYTITGLGDGDDVDRYFASQSLVLVQVVRMGGGTTAITGGMGYSYSAEDTIDITVGTVTSGTAANCDIRLTVMYTLDN